MSSASSGTPASARRQEASLDLPVDPPRDGESKQAWVYRQIRERVLRARCRPARASTRSLAQRWRIARSTVEAAYDQLRGEGYTAGTVGSGTYVAAVIPDNFFRKGLPGERASWARMPGIRRARPRSPRPSRGRAAARPLPHEQPVTPADQAESAEPPFASRSADALFPMAAWSKGLAVSARQLTPAQLTRDEPQGWPALREQIARYLGRRAASSAMPRRSWCCPASATAWTCAAGSC